jgi:uncharacterized phiE125 gp8 family phage protein
MALCTLDQVKAHFGFGDNAEQEVELERLIGVAQELIEKYCGRKFDEATFTEYWNGDGTSLLFVKNYPIISITSIHDDIGDHTYGADTLVDADDYTIINNNHIQMYDSFFQTGVNNIKIVYVAGYSDETVGTHEPIPEDLRQACIQQVGWMFKRGIGHNYGVNSKSLDDGTIQFIETGDLLPAVKNVIRRYRRISY